jgi:hypothetical protein
MPTMAFLRGTPLVPARFVALDSAARHGTHYRPPPASLMATVVMEPEKRSMMVSFMDHLEQLDY